jgi:autotransporter passenger strand-loop-strand repeat protein
MTTTYVSSGAVSSGLIIEPSNQLIVLSGGEAEAITLSANYHHSASATVSGGGLISGLRAVGQLASVVIESGGEALDTNLSGSTEFVGGIASGITGGGYVTVAGGGIASGISLGFGYVTVARGGIASGISLGFGYVTVAGHAFGLVLSGGLESVVSGGRTSGALIKSGAQELVSSGGEARGTQVLFGGVEQLVAGGVASGVRVSSGATLVLDAAVVGSGQVITAGGQALATTAISGVKLLQGGVWELSAATIESRGLVCVVNGEHADSSHVMQGGVVRISSGGSTSRSFVSFGGTETVLSGGSSNNASLEGGVEFDYGLAQATRVDSGLQEVGNHGVAVSAIVGGSQTILSGGVASVSIVYGAETVSNGGLAVATQVYGTQTILSGGKAIANGGGTTRNGLDAVSGELIVSSGGSLVGSSSVEGTLTVESGGSLSGFVAISGGTVVVAGNARADVRFGASGVLEIDNANGFHGLIKNLPSVSGAAAIDLTEFAFSGDESLKWKQTGTSGTLTLLEGTNSANLVVKGSFVTSEFHLADDGHGGTSVSVPQAGGFAREARFAESLAAFNGGRRDALAVGPVRGPTANGAAPVLVTVTSGA